MSSLTRMMSTDLNGCPISSVGPGYFSHNIASDERGSHPIRARQGKSHAEIESCCLSRFVIKTLCNPSIHAYHVLSTKRIVIRAINTIIEAVLTTSAKPWTQRHRVSRDYQHQTLIQVLYVSTGPYTKTVII
jgi:hypothetical protein